MGAKTSSLTNEDPVNQLFFVDKCVSKATGEDTPFYEWCSDPGVNKPYQAKCSNIYGSTGECNYTLSFNAQHTLREQRSCSLGTKNETPAPENHKISNSTYSEIIEHCIYKAKGTPFAWWATLLIVLSILVLLAIGAALIWRYWLKKRWYPPVRGSTLESRWTDSPVSNISAAPSAHKPGAVAPPLSMQPLSNKLSTSASSRRPSVRSASLPLSGNKISRSSSSSRKRRGV